MRTPGDLYFLPLPPLFVEHALDNLKAALQLTRDVVERATKAHACETHPPSRLYVQWVADGVTFSPPVAFGLDDYARLIELVDVVAWNASDEKETRSDDARRVVSRITMRVLTDRHPL